MKDIHPVRVSHAGERVGERRQGGAEEGTERQRRELDYSQGRLGSEHAICVSAVACGSCWSSKYRCCLLRSTSCSSSFLGGFLDVGIYLDITILLISFAEIVTRWGWGEGRLKVRSQGDTITRIYIAWKQFTNMSF